MRSVGWTIPSELERLRELAWEVPAECAIVEIGSYLGESAIALARGAADGAGAPRVHCVDPWIGPTPGTTGQDPLNLGTGDAWYAAFLDNIEIAGVADQITVHRETSAEAASRWTAEQPIGLLFIDAVHDYDPILQDYTLWSPYVVEAGWLAFHDFSSGFPDTERVINEHVLPSGLWSRVKLTNSLWTAQRLPNT